MNIEDVVIRSVELLRPEPGDVLLITMPDSCSPAQRTAVARSFQEACGREVRVACLPHTFSVRVVRAADIPAEEPPPSLDMGIQRVGFDAVSESPIIKPGESTML